MTAYDQLPAQLAAAPKTWLITGAAGFIGSNLLEQLLRLGQTVRGLDNFATGFQKNLDEVQAAVTPDQWQRFSFVPGDIRDRDTCQRLCEGVDCVLHQAAMASVPRSLADPAAFNEVNVSGTLNLLLAVRDQRVKRLVYASSSSVYGDEPTLPKVESRIGAPLSPYAATKLMDEIYAATFATCYGLETVGLRYFNVFGPRQDPDGAYAAVIPKWIASLLKREPVYINGDGETTRDFCYIANVVQANLLAATAAAPPAANRVYNVAVGERTSLNQLFEALRQRLAPQFPAVREQRPVYREFRAGDVRHSLADIAQAQQRLGYAPTHRLAEGLQTALQWYLKNVR
jgi:UDP-N-acetylglucosamine/UDP-N-acetylgalactosamine 4-epimerase